jgi:hypothetical protein
MDERDGLLLSTDYETMSSWERFSFAGPNVRLRSSTVEGLSNTASFCIETRCLEAESATAVATASDRATAAPNLKAASVLSPLGW